MCVCCDLNTIRIFEFRNFVWVLVVYLLCHFTSLQYFRGLERTVQCDVRVTDCLPLDSNSYSCICY